MYNHGRPTCFLAFLLLLAACESPRPESDEFVPDVPPRDDAGEADANDVEVDGDAADLADGPDVELPDEVENNDPFHGGAAQPLGLPALLDGTIDFPTADRPDLDVFAVTATAGAMLRVTAFPSSTVTVDLALRVLRLDEAGRVVWERSADDPASFSAYRDAYLPEDGEYLVVVSDRANFAASPASWRGGSTFGYQLSVSALTPPAMTVPALPWTWTGALPTAGLIQTATFTPLAGSRLEATLSSSDGRGFDPLLTVFDAAARRVVGENDDGAGGDDALVRLDVSGGPLVFVVDHVFADGGRPVSLTLDVRELDPATEVEPNDLADSADPVVPGATAVRGTIDAPTSVGGVAVEDRDLFRFEAEAGQAYALEVAREGGAASELDPYVSALRLGAGSARLAAENPLAMADDSPTRGDLDARLVVVARRDGPLFAEVRDARNVARERDGLPPVAGGSTHRYELRLSMIADPPSVDLGEPSVPVIRDGTAAVGGTPDFFRFSVAGGTPLALSLSDLSMGPEPFEPLVLLTDAADATILVAVAPGSHVTATGYAFAAGAGGLLRVADALGAGDAAFRYRLGLQAFRAAAEAETVAANETLATAQLLDWAADEDGVVVTGRLDRSAGAGPDGVDFYRVALDPGARMAAFTGPTGGDALDTVLVLHASDGTVLAENDDVTGAETLFSAAEATAGSDGVLFVEILPWGSGAVGGYTLYVGGP